MRKSRHTDSRHKGGPLSHEHDRQREAKHWRASLGQYIKEHNWRHATKDKGVSYRTMEERRDSLFRIFGWLREAGFKLGPSSLGSRHVEFLMRYLTADPSVADELRARGSTMQPLSEPKSPAYIQSLLSTLRVFSTWIDKPGLVLPAERYVDKALVERSGNATRDRTWTGAEVDIQAVIARVTEADPVVGLQLEVAMAFGLRRKEAVMFCPTLALVPAHALPPDETSTPWVCFLKVKRGTKGGRLRFVALRSDVQRQVHERALKAAPHPGMHIGRPGQNLKQALDRFSNVLRKCGVTMEELGVTAHGLRHQFASDLYFELTEVLPPVKGGDPHLSRETMNAAYQEVARQLGHNRPGISGAYLGSRSSRPATADED